MFSKTIFVLFFAALAQLQLVVATPPACLLGAVKDYSDPSDLSAVCKEKDVTSKISKLCGSNTDAALSALAEVCNNAGVKVSTSVIASASGTGAYPSASGTGAYPSASGTGSAYGSGANNGTIATTIATATGGSVPSATGSGSTPESTGAAGKLELSAAALVAGFGFLAAAL